TPPLLTWTPAPRAPAPTPLPYTTLFRSRVGRVQGEPADETARVRLPIRSAHADERGNHVNAVAIRHARRQPIGFGGMGDETDGRSEEHTSELQSPDHLVCRRLLEKKKGR